jgi:hypothetical protein
MQYFKKLLFGGIFLILFTGLHFFLFPLLTSYEWIFGLNQSSFNQIIQLSLLLIFSSMSLVIFFFLVNHRLLGVGLAVLGALIPVAFSFNSTGFLLCGLYLLTFITSYFLVENTSRHYISFSAPTLLIPHIKTLATLILIIICIGYYLTINLVIKEKGFSIPEAIIPDSVIENLINQQMDSMTIKGDKYIAQLPQLTAEQLQILKQNPDLLRQYGVDPAILDQYDQQTAPIGSVSSTPRSTPNSKAIQVPTSTATSPTVAVVKKMALAPVNDLIKDYQFLVAPILALLLFSAFSFVFFFFFLFNFISGGIIKIIFYILEKTGFIHFQKEMREVQKLVI